MASGKNPGMVTGGRPRLWKILASVLGLSVVLSAMAFLTVGRWLVVEDPPEQASAVAVLSGSMMLRCPEAARLYQQGYAPEIWLTHSSEPGADLAAMGIPFSGEDYYCRQILVHEGVPATAIRVLDPPIVNTADELRVIGAALQGERDRSVLIVTTKAHTRRTRLLWRRLAAGQGRAMVRAAGNDPFDSAHWWRNTTDALDVVREVLGLLNAWAGLPVRPAR